MVHLSNEFLNKLSTKKVKDVLMKYLNWACIYFIPKILELFVA